MDGLVMALVMRATICNNGNAWLVHQAVLCWPKSPTEAGAHRCCTLLTLVKLNFSLHELFPKPRMVQTTRPTNMESIFLLCLFKAVDPSAQGSWKYIYTFGIPGSLTNRLLFAIAPSYSSIASLLYSFCIDISSPYRHKLPITPP